VEHYRGFRTRIDEYVRQIQSGNVPEVQPNVPSPMRGGTQKECIVVADDSDGDSSVMYVEQRSDPGDGDYAEVISVRSDSPNPRA
jgi:hypothetical protein